MVKIWLMMSVISIMVLLFYRYVVFVYITNIVLLTAVIATIITAAYCLDILTYHLMYRNYESTPWFIGIATGLVTLLIIFLVVFFPVMQWSLLSIAIGVVCIGLFVICGVYVVYLSKILYTTISVSIFVSIFLLGIGISTYLFDSNKTVISFVLTYTLPLSIAVFDEIRYRKYNKSWFLQPD